jgi:crinkler effector protein
MLRRAFECPELEAEEAETGTERIRPKSHDLLITISRCQHSNPRWLNVELGLTLWCYIKGDRNYFPVSISPNHNIHELKRRIYAEGDNSFVGCNVKDLNLAKVRYITISM